ncbi:MAG TPA: mannose-6-phosphate isomerase, partial [Actinomycetota bacterium]|nr:mannose-6-phosphate isomerase [Actinomycetota bacterium]
MTASGGGPRDLRLPTGRTAPGNYDLRPFVPSGVASECTSGWDAVTRAIHSTGARVVIVECYPGVARGDVLRLAPPDTLLVDAADALLPPDEIRRLTQPFVTDDPVFGRMARLGLRDLFDPTASMRLRERIASHDGRVFVHGTGASMLCDEGLLVYAGLPRWEATLRQRRGESSSLGLDDAGSRPGELYKRAFFVDWRVADRHRKTLWDRVGFILDTTQPERPKLLDARTYYRALAAAARRPLRVVPTFDPAPWGGHWIQRVCDVGQDRDNIGWCFDCIPEENSLLLGFGDERFECPSIDLVFRHPRELLGEAVFGRFGDEFPIRFDFLDTIGGGNLSLQVHPLTAYIREKFGIPYTQDESYYLLDAEPHASVLLGLRTGIDPDEMVRDLRAADQGRA